MSMRLPSLRRDEARAKRKAKQRGERARKIRERNER